MKKTIHNPNTMKHTKTIGAGLIYAQTENGPKVLVPFPNKTTIADAEHIESILNTKKPEHNHVESIDQQLFLRLRPHAPLWKYAKMKVKLKKGVKLLRTQNTSNLSKNDLSAKWWETLPTFLKLIPKGIKKNRA